MAIYRFSKDVTSDANLVHSAISAPVDGLIFYDPLQSYSDSTETGQSLNYVGNISYQDYKGISAPVTDGSSYIYATDAFEPSPDGAYTISGWVVVASTFPSEDYRYLFGIGGSGTGARLTCAHYGTVGGLVANVGGTSIFSGVSYPEGLNHVLITYDGVNTVSIYINGKLSASGELTTTISTYDVSIFTRPDLNYGSTDGTIVTAMRVYNRVLTESEIQTLSQEIVKAPVTSVGFDELGYPIAYDSASAAGILTIKMPEDGLVFYSALTSSEGFDNALGNPQFVEKDGIPCVYFDGESLLNVYLDGMPQGSSARTISFFFRYDDFYEDCAMVATGNSAPNEQYDIGMNGNRKICVWGWDNDTTYSFAPDYNEFYHCVITLESDGTEKLYINGELMQTKVHSDLNTTGDEICVGSEFGAWYFTGYMAALRVYNRALSADEIQQLAKEFTV